MQPAYHPCTTCCLPFSHFQITLLWLVVWACSCIMNTFSWSWNCSEIKIQIILLKFIMYPKGCKFMRFSHNKNLIIFRLTISQAVFSILISYIVYWYAYGVEFFVCKINWQIIQVSHIQFKARLQLAIQSYKTHNPTEENERRLYFNYVQHFMQFVCKLLNKSAQINSNFTFKKNRYL